MGVSVERYEFFVSDLPSKASSFRLFSILFKNIIHLRKYFVNMLLNSSC
ncbi:hypothetical protein CLOSTMETH_02979 [[Clostridium] methylpentosum DSM 5476]|uniref:Uncharacterized protein n=1 Tax=[Clostridium] methylpentosum DSM 5476 TaxID=537013 RepID=C0EGI6_9FIRM|nr:hypothetical protein CLOSTMETH_02979 [[Clostridium] methylpentosum DSM 5476]